MENRVVLTLEEDGEILYSVTFDMDTEYAKDGKLKGRIIGQQTNRERSSRLIEGMNYPLRDIYTEVLGSAIKYAKESAIEVKVKGIKE
jgi:hypothetical protein